MAATLGIRDAFNDLPLSNSTQNWPDRLYPTTTEECSVAFEKLTRQPITGNTLIGTSGLSILNIVALRGIKAASNHEKIENVILIDRSPCTEHFWKSMQGIMESSSDRKMATEKIKAHLKKNHVFYFQNVMKVCKSSTTLGRRPFEEELMNEIIQIAFGFLDQEIASGSSFLSNDAYFSKIKIIFEENKFTFLRMDLQNDTHIGLLAQRLRELGLTTDLIYLSNIAEFIDNEKPIDSVHARRAAYVSSIDKLTRNGTLFLKSAWRKCRECEPQLQLTLTRKSAKPLTIKDMFPKSPFTLCDSCKVKIHR